MTSTSPISRRRPLLISVGASVLCFTSISGAAIAQQVEPEKTSDSGEEVVVTGSRVIRNGYNAPTPLTVTGIEELEAEAPANVADFVNTLPSVRGSTTVANSSGSLSNGLAGISALNLRSLGTARTLVLLDGQRSVASAATGVVDVNTFPQPLIERVDIVTGGASAAYGSDAVSGVVNFLLDRDYTGQKASIEYGVTTYGDGENMKATYTLGTPFAEGKGHFLFSAELFNQAGIQTNDRDWNDNGFFQMNNPARADTTISAAERAKYPERFVSAGIGTNQTHGGLIVSGPLRGTYFGLNGQPGTLALGQSNGQFMLGGDWEETLEGHEGTNSLTSDEDREAYFARLSYDVASWISVFAQASYNRFEGFSYYQQTPTTATIQIDNPYLPASVRAQMVTAGITSFTINTTNAGIPRQGSNNVRTVERYVGGAEGEFGLWGDTALKWDAYYQRGVANLTEQLVDAYRTARLTNATDAVLLGGEIVCRSAAARAEGCAPLNRIGINTQSEAALDYLLDNPYRQQKVTQDVAAITFSSEPFNNWAGPVSIAFGAEHREEKVDGFVPPEYQSGWVYGNYLVTAGSYTVDEGFLETVVPLFKGADFNGAVRQTYYSTSGSVTTWKAGLTYAPIEDIKFRVVQSRDIRAPNLNELFAPGTARGNSVNIPCNLPAVAALPICGGATSVQSKPFQQKQTGNPNLQPEEADSLGIGVVLSPRFFPGFSASIDYYNIEITGGIGSVSAQNTVDLCYEQGVMAFCPNIGFNSTGTALTDITLVPFNLASQEAKGVDFDASYRFDLGGGSMTLRALVTKYIDNITTTGIPGDAPLDAAGSISMPDLVYRLSARYDAEPWSYNITMRGFDDSVYNNSFIECSYPDCPVSTPNARTINENDIEGAMYIDASFTRDIEIGGKKTEAFLSIINLFDRDPEPVGNGPDGNNTPAYPQTNRSLYDTVGRTFRMGMRFDF